MKSTLWGVGLIFSTLSIVMLIKQGFDVGFGSALQVILSFYDEAVHKVLGWAEPGIRAWFKTFGWDLHLYPHWKHVVVLYWLYFGAEARTRFEGIKNAESDKRNVYRIVTSLTTAAGAVVAVVFGILCGTLSLDDPRTNLPLLLIAVCGIILYRLANAVARAAGYHLGFGWVWPPIIDGEIGGSSVTRGACLVAVSIVVLAWASAAVPAIAAVPSVAVLFVLIIGVALNNLWYAKTQVENSIFLEDYTRELTGKPPLGLNERREWWRNEFPTHCRMGLLMLSSVGGASLFLLTNAGLTLAGLS
jgi:hypothetical protein